MSYEIVRADLLNNKQDLLNIWMNNSVENINDRYNWIYNNNPFVAAYVWLLKHIESNSCVGSLSNWRHSGFNVFCGPRIKPDEKDTMENLARYIIRAFFSQESGIGDVLQNIN